MLEYLVIFGIRDFQRCMDVRPSGPGPLGKPHFSLFVRHASPIFSHPLRWWGGGSTPLCPSTYIYINWQYGQFSFISEPILHTYPIVLLNFNILEPFLTFPSGPLLFCLVGNWNSRSHISYFSILSGNINPRPSSTSRSEDTHQLTS